VKTKIIPPSGKREKGPLAPASHENGRKSRLQAIRLLCQKRKKGRRLQQEEVRKTLMEGGDPRLSRDHREGVEKKKVTRIALLSEGGKKVGGSYTEEEGGRGSFSFDAGGNRSSCST